MLKTLFTAALKNLNSAEILIHLDQLGRKTNALRQAQTRQNTKAKASLKISTMIGRSCAALNKLEQRTGTNESDPQQLIIVESEWRQLRI